MGSGSRQEKSIKNNIMRTVLTLMSISLVTLGLVMTILLYTNSISVLKDTLTDTAQSAAERVEMEIVSYKNVVREIGNESRLSSDALSIEEKQAIMRQKVESYGLESGNIIGVDGISIFNGINCNGYSYFEASMNGEVYITEPLISQETGKLTYIISAPLWEGGNPDTTVVGVILVITPENFLSRIVESIEVSDNSIAYIIDSNGTTVAHEDFDRMRSFYNTIEEARSDTSLRKLAEMEAKMIEDEVGFGSYRHNGSLMYLVYAPVPNSNGWSLGINAPVGDFIGSTIMAIVITVIVVIVFVVISGLYIHKMAENIGKPIMECTERLNAVAKGDLGSPVPDSDREDEIGILTRATQQIVNSTNFIIGDIHYVLQEMAEGNFKIRSKDRGAYIGDYRSILDSMIQLHTSMSDTLLQIESAAGQVSVGSEQMASGAQNLAENSSDQAVAVEELLDSANQVAKQVNHSASQASETSSRVRDMEEQAKENTKQMESMIHAMKRINEASRGIAKIISTIEEIASQTNLLSLNAAIEAARAGEIGKGFAVVAQEIRQLASQSSEAVENTRGLIETAVKEVDLGTEIVETTADSLKGIIEGMGKIAEEINDVSGDIVEQAAAVSRMSDGVEQISAVIQNNSSTAEESAATSEELAAQAGNLNELLEKFIFHDNSEDNSIA